jgi:hypothetical protein
MCYQEEAYHDGLWVQFDGFRPMKRPSSGDARSAPARCVKQGAVRWQGGVPRTDYFWFGPRGYSRFDLDGLSSFIYLLMTLDC